jgi:hypothetical protein
MAYACFTSCIISIIVLAISARTARDDGIILRSRQSASFVAINASFPGVYYIRKTPLIFRVDGFLTADECKELRRAASAVLKRSTLTVDALAVVADERTSLSAFLPKREWLERRIALLTAWPVESQEMPQVTRYSAGQYYGPHFDHFDPRHPGASRDNLDYG